ncbi:PepSY domain-containing protein [Lyngbya aestuarii]|uniref:PepSY domain-containing protein n=1 Tax=Lyngbya aestuarii TaxID=118322 RepID=UPI00403D5A7F
MNTSTKWILATAILGTLGLGGFARTVQATQSKPAVAIASQHHHSSQIAEASDGDGEVPDAIETPELGQPQQPMANKTQLAQAEASDGDGEVPDHLEDQQEAAKLQTLAKTTPQQAKQAAEAAQGATASRVTLDNEDGNLVYKAIIGQTEVAVDAGNGKVLYTENVNQEGEANEVTHPRSSIQVPHTDAEDNETNDER